MFRKKLSIRAATVSAFLGAAFAIAPAHAAPVMSTYYVTCANGSEVDVVSAFPPDPMSVCGPIGYNGGVIGKRKRILDAKPDVPSPKVVSGMGAAVPIEETVSKLNALVATPRFVAMRKARDYRGMGDALAGIGVAIEMPSQAMMPLCTAPRQWIWAQRFIKYSNGMQGLTWVLVCGWPGDVNPN